MSTAFEQCPAPPRLPCGSAEPAAPSARSTAPTSAVLETVFRHRGALLLLAAAPIAGAVLSGSGLEAWEAASGGALLVGGALLRLFCVRWIGKRARVRTSGAVRLLSEGPFARVRNPLYLGNLAITCGAALLAGLGVWTLALSAYVLLVYHFVVMGEEVTLEELFRERYVLYTQRVPRWLPRLRASEPVEATPTELWPWADVLRREGPTMLVGVTIAFSAIVYVRAGGPGVPWLRGILVQVAAMSGLPLWAVAAVVVILLAVGEGVFTDRKRRRHERARAALEK